MQTFIDSINLAKEKLINGQELIFTNQQDFSFSKASQKIFEKEKSEANKTEINNFEQNLNDSR